MLQNVLYTMLRMIRSLPSFSLAFTDFAASDAPNVGDARIIIPTSTGSSTEYASLLTLAATPPPATPAAVAAAASDPR